MALAFDPLSQVFIFFAAIRYVAVAVRYKVRAESCVLFVPLMVFVRFDLFLLDLGVAVPVGGVTHSWLLAVILLDSRIWLGLSFFKILLRINDVWGDLFMIIVISNNPAKQIMDITGGGFSGAL